MGIILGEIPLILVQRVDCCADKQSPNVNQPIPSDVCVFFAIRYHKNTREIRKRLRN